MLWGYNTNGWAHHRLEDAIEVLAEIGYRSVAITIDYGALAPGAECAAQLQRVAHQLTRLGMASVIETGARYVLDPRRKHYPTLLCADESLRRKRRQFLEHAIDCAAQLGSRCVSLWSGVAEEPTDQDGSWSRLTDELGNLCDYAQRAGVVVGFEPEPGMFIATMQDYAELLRRCSHDNLRLTLDIGHVHCQGEGAIDQVIHRWAPWIVNVHLEDMRRGVHEHLMFGEGEMDFRAILRALGQCHYAGPVHVELSRHSHDAPVVARKALAFLRHTWQEVQE